VELVTKVLSHQPKVLTAVQVITTTVVVEVEVQLPQVLVVLTEWVVQVVLEQHQALQAHQ
jgi:hypothetical protein